MFTTKHQWLSSDIYVNKWKGNWRWFSPSRFECHHFSAKINAEAYRSFTAVSHVIIRTTNVTLSGGILCERSMTNKEIALCPTQLEQRRPVSRNTKKEIKERKMLEIISFCVFLGYTHSALSRLQLSIPTVVYLSCNLCVSGFLFVAGFAKSDNWFLICVDAVTNQWPVGAGTCWHLKPVLSLQKEYRWAISWQFYTYIMRFWFCMDMCLGWCLYLFLWPVNDLR